MTKTCVRCARGNCNTRSAAEPASDRLRPLSGSRGSDQLLVPRDPDVQSVLPVAFLTEVTCRTFCVWGILILDPCPGVMWKDPSGKASWNCWRTSACSKDCCQQSGPRDLTLRSPTLRVACSTQAFCRAIRSARAWTNTSSQRDRCFKYHLNIATPTCHLTWAVHVDADRNSNDNLSFYEQ